MNYLSFADMPARVWYAQNLTTGETVFRPSRDAARGERTLMKNRGANKVRIGYFATPVVDQHG